MEFSPLSSIWFQQMLLEMGHMKLDDSEKYEDCPLVEKFPERDGYFIPKYLKLSRLLHETPLLVVEYPKIMRVVYNGEIRPPNDLKQLIFATRKHGCQFITIGSFGLSVGVRSLNLTPTELRIFSASHLEDTMDRTRLAVLQDRKRNFIASDGGIITPDGSDLHRLRTNLTRMKAKGISLQTIGKGSLSLGETK